MPSHKAAKHATCHSQILPHYLGMPHSTTPHQTQHQSYIPNHHARAVGDHALQRMPRGSTLDSLAGRRLRKREALVGLVSRPPASLDPARTPNKVFSFSRSLSMKKILFWYIAWRQHSSKRVNHCLNIVSLCHNTFADCVISMANCYALYLHSTLNSYPIA